jgi:hypothetical protein
VLRLSNLAPVRVLDTSGYQPGMVSVAPDGTIVVVANREATTDQKAFLFSECGWTPVKVLDYGPVNFAENGVGALLTLAWSQNSDQLYDLFVAKAVGIPFLALGVTTVRH